MFNENLYVRNLSDERLQDYDDDFEDDDGDNDDEEDNSRSEKPRPVSILHACCGRVMLPLWTCVSVMPAVCCSMHIFVCHIHSTSV